MAKQRTRDRGGDEKKNTGLIVSLVISTILAITFGVFTYLGYSGKADAEKQAKAASDKATAAEKKAREEEAAKLALKVAAGIETDADRTTLAGRRAEAQAVIARELTGLKSLPKWDGGSEKPPKSYEAMVQDLRAAANTAVQRQKAADDNLEEQKKKFAEAVQELDGKLKTAQDNLKKANEEVVALTNRKEASFDDASKKIKELSEQVQQLTLDKQNLDVDKSREITKLREKIDSMTKVRVEFQTRVGPLMEKLGQEKNRHPDMRELTELHEMLAKQIEGPQSLVNDTPKGTITQVQRSSGQLSDKVYINLGSADYVKPGLTFSVLPAGLTGKVAAGRDRKGAVEIVAVLEPHLSAAKAVEVVAPIRDPLMAGDLLFNPAWSSSQREHVALAGIIDLNGDGIDDTPDLIRALEKQGVLVDAWLDLKDRTIKGPGISEKTTYLILGESPTYGSIPLEGNKVSEATGDILTKIDEMKNKARDLGVERVPYRKFLSLIGYRLPKLTQPVDYSATSYLRGSGGAIKPVENGKEPKESKEEKPK
jgi:hypothetical protein